MQTCGELLQQSASTPPLKQSDTAAYLANEEVPEPPRNTLMMHLGIGSLIGFGIRLGFFLAIAEIIALVIMAPILVVFVAVLKLLGVVTNWS